MLNNLINVDLHIHSAASSYKEQPGLVAECDADHCDVLLDKLADPDNDIRLLQSKSLKVARDRFELKRCVRTSLSGYRDESWLTNLPLWAIAVLGPSA